MEYGLPKSVTLSGAEYAVRYDYRAILDIFEVLNEENATQSERISAALQIFYPDCEDLPGYPLYQEAIGEMFRFINGGKPEAQTGKKPQLVSWDKDFPYIVSAVNRVLGYEVRSIPYTRKENTGGVHWWTFLSAYMEIGDCLFSQIVGIRSKVARGKKLDNGEKEFYRQNRDLIDIKTKISDEQADFILSWSGKKAAP